MRLRNTYKPRKETSEADKEKIAVETKARAKEIGIKTHLSSIERKKKRKEPLKSWDTEFLAEQEAKSFGGWKPMPEGIATATFDGRPFDTATEITWSDLSRCSEVLRKIERDELEESASQPLLQARGAIVMNVKILSGDPVVTRSEATRQEMLAARDHLRSRLTGTEAPETAAQDFLKAEAEIRVIFGDAPLALTETEQGKLLSLFEEYRKLDTRWYKFAENAARVKIAFPDLSLDITDLDVRSINREINKYAPGTDEKLAMLNAPTFAYLIACLTILDRNNFDITPFTWNAMRVAFRDAQKKLLEDSARRLSDRHNGSDGAKEAESFSRFAVSLKIIAAARVEVTDGGLEVINKIL